MKIPNILRPLTRRETKTEFMRSIIGTLSADYNEAKSTLFINREAYKNDNLKQVTECNTTVLDIYKLVIVNLDYVSWSHPIVINVCSRDSSHISRTKSVCD